MSSLKIVNRSSVGTWSGWARVELVVRYLAAAGKCTLRSVMVVV